MPLMFCPPRDAVRVKLANLVCASVLLARLGDGWHISCRHTQDVWYSGCDRLWQVVTGCDRLRRT